MKKTRAHKLAAAAKECAEQFSNPDRAQNHAKEEFHIGVITPLGESSALVTYNKTPSGKKAAAWFYWLNVPHRNDQPDTRDKGQWRYFFVTYSHLAGMDIVARTLHQIEQHNFPLNWDEERR